MDERLFEALVLERFNAVFPPACASMQEMIARYHQLTPRQQTSVFSDKQGDGYKHVIDQLIGKKPFQFISFSKKHFNEVVVPRYTHQRWPRELLADYKQLVTVDIEEHLRDTRLGLVAMKRNEFVNQLIAKYRVDQLPYQKLVFYHMCAYQYKQMEQQMERGKKGVSAKREAQASSTVMDTQTLVAMLRQLALE